MMCCGLHRSRGVFRNVLPRNLGFSPSLSLANKLASTAGTRGCNRSFHTKRARYSNSLVEPVRLRLRVRTPVLIEIKKATQMRDLFLCGEAGIRTPDTDLVRMTV